jgi:hypothetical protein
MLQDAWLDARARMLEFVDLHGNAVWICVVVLVVAYFAYRWIEAR